MSETRYDELCHTLAKLWREVWLSARWGHSRRKSRLMHLVRIIEYRLAHSVFEGRALP